MEKEKLGQEPAYPMLDPNSDYHVVGMSKRFYAACCAMQGVLSLPGNTSTTTIKDIVRASYELADELLKQENE